MCLLYPIIAQCLHFYELNSTGIVKNSTILHDENTLLKQGFCILGEFISFIFISLIFLLNHIFEAHQNITQNVSLILVNRLMNGILMG